MKRATRIFSQKQAENGIFFGKRIVRKKKTAKLKKEKKLVPQDALLWKFS